MISEIDSMYYHKSDINIPSTFSDDFHQVYGSLIWFYDVDIDGDNYQYLVTLLLTSWHDYSMYFDNYVYCDNTVVKYFTKYHTFYDQ